MYITPVNFYNFNNTQNSSLHRFKNQNSKINFGSADTVTIVSKKVIAPNEEQTAKNPSYLQKCRDLKKYNIDTKSMLRLASLKQEDYEFALAQIFQNPERKKALISKDTKLKFEKSALEFDGITQNTYDYDFSNGYGYRSCTKTVSNSDEHKLNVQRTEDGFLKNTSVVLEDRSPLNPDYKIKNIYKHITEHNDGMGECSSRNISIKTKEGDKLLGYKYLKSSLASSGLTECSVNGRKYIIKVSKDGNVKIVSGNKKADVSFADKLNFYVLPKKDFKNEEARMKAVFKAKRKAESDTKTFVEALKMLPPQIILSAGDTFKTIKSGVAKPTEDALYINICSPELAAQSIIDGTIEVLAQKNGLTENTELTETFKNERKAYNKWLINQSEGCIIRDSSSYIREHNNEKEDLMQTIKLICKLIWTEEYENGRTTDEQMRLLLNFFPKTVSSVMDIFELNNK